MMKRVKANDPAALNQMGLKCYHEGDYDAAFKYLTKAAELGDTDAHAQLGLMHMKGEGVKKDDEKAVSRWEKAAIGGHVGARYNLGYYEERNGNIERAVKHFIISAKLGHDNSMKALWRYYSAGNITKEDLNATLRTHHAAINAMKSAQRDIADKCSRKT
jgi:TPR repeat protein